MAKNKTRFIAIEGCDGTGKKTQLDLLAKYFRDKLGKAVLELDFPRYSEVSSRYVQRYLNGEYGHDVAPDLASMLYAFDRWQAKPIVDKFVKDHPDGLIITNRYTTSNLAHQGGKIADSEARRRFYDEMIDLEFNQFGILRPDVNFVMLMPEDAAQLNVDKKATRTYTNKKRDILEADLNHLRNATAAYREICQLFPTDFTQINCWDAESQTMLPIDAIHQILIKSLRLS
jgi:dTMP kinase